MKGDTAGWRLERKQVAEARDRARRALADIAEHITDGPSQDRESHRYRGRLGWAAGSLDADLRAIESYFDALDEQCRVVDHEAHRAGT